MRVVPGGTVLVSGVRMTVLCGRAGICGGQEARGRKRLEVTDTDLYCHILSII